MDYKVISLDNYSTGCRSNHFGDLDYREGHTKDIARYITEIPDVVFHLGEYARVAASLNEAATVWDFNITGTLGVLEFCRTNRCKLVYVGSSTKFSDGPDGEKTGRHLSPYTLSKAINSELVYDYARWYGLRYVIVYLHNVYGPRERSANDHGTLIETFRSKYIAGEPLEVRAPGTQRRYFTHVFDAVAGIILAAENGMGDGYQICSRDYFSVLDVAGMFGGKIQMLPPRNANRMSAFCDNSKIGALGWRQTYFLEEYVQSIKKKPTMQGR
jgi:UDP-glucose 4-epimerase